MASPSMPHRHDAPHAFPLKPVLWLLASMLALALGTSLAKQLFPLVGAQGTTALRLVFSALVLMLLGRPWRHRLPRQDWWVVLRYGATLGLMNLLFYMSLRTTPFGIAVAVEFCGPLSVALCTSRRPMDFLWIGCAVAGLLLLLPIWPTPRHLATALPAVGGTAVTHPDMQGLMYAAGAAVCWAGYIIFGKRTHHLHAGMTVALGVMTGAVLVFPVGLMHAGSMLFAPKVLTIGLGTAVVSSAIPMFLEMKAMRGLRAGTYGVLTSLEPALTSLVALVTLGERLTWPQWCAIGLTVTAAMGSTLTGRQPERA